MPRLSIVLVTHREQGFLRRCLASVLDQGSADLEVVAVDDAAPDHSAQILAEVAAADPRVRVQRLPERHGPGPARQAGLSMSTGEYVWFVDATDLLPAGALSAVLAALEENSPQVLVVDHDVREVDGRHRAVRVGPDGSPHLWDKVVEADLMRSAADALSSGTGWEARAVSRLLAAGRVERLGESAYVRRALPVAVRRRSDPDAAPDAAPAVPSSRNRRQTARGLARRLVREARAWRKLPGRVRRWPADAFYRAELRRPLEPDLAVYAAYWYTAYSCNPRAIYEKARELAPWLRGVWVVEADKVDRVPAGVAYVVAGTRDYYRTMARATYLVNNVNFPNDIVKRPGQVHLQTHHGTPLKTMGLDLVDAQYGRRRMNFHRLMKRVARWDVSISQNAFTTEQWERVYPGTYESLETGYPRNDVLADATPDDVARVRAELGIEPGRTVVLYTPTHREYHTEFVAQLDPQQLAASLGQDYVLLMRTHYFYRDGQAVGSDAPAGVIDVADHPRIEDLYLAADVLVTDYSSVMFDYAVLDRPIVIYAPDWEEYRTLRGTYFDLMASPPGLVTTTEEGLADVLRTRRAWDDESAAHRQAFRTTFCSLEDGRASERVVRRLWPAPPGGHA